MDTKPLLYGLAGFFIGGLLVSIAATTFDKPQPDTDEMSMTQMVDSLKDEKGDAYDAVFIANMIEHHQSAVDMAKLSESRAKHDEVKQLSQEIITAQEKEIAEMKAWQKQWGYDPDLGAQGGH
jgi:uncharacterized protein (DUF305 family)